MARASDQRRGGQRRSGQRGELDVSAWLDQHRAACAMSLRKLLTSPLATLLTAAVIGIALALPTAFFALLHNAQSLGSDWDGAARISLYLGDAVAEAEGAALADQLAARSDIASTRHIGRDAALAEFRELSGFGEVLDSLGENPLPGVVVVHPLATAAPDAVAALAEELGALKTVDDALVDLQWVQRLHAIIGVIQRTVAIVAALLGVAVLLVVGNTIRLDILGRREEIVVVKLIGATDGFVRRPFLYGGAIYGLLGGALAVLLVGLALGLIAEPARDLAQLYGSAFEFSGLNLDSALTLMLCGMLLGLGGAWLAVGRHLRDIEPR